MIVEVLLIDLITLVVISASNASKVILILPNFFLLKVPCFISYLQPLASLLVFLERMWATPLEPQILRGKMEQHGHFFKHTLFQHIHGCNHDVFVIMEGFMLCQELKME